jgi:hypothetical protein
VHFSSKTPEHYTPPEFLEAVCAVFDGIPDLDPCSDSSARPTVAARRHFTRQENGLMQPWAGRVYMNPPYGREIGKWIRKLRSEWQRGAMTDAIALLPARPDTAWFEALTLDTDDAVICFLRGRLRFVGQRSSAPFPSMAVYFGRRQAAFARVFEEWGSLWMPARSWRRAGRRGETAMMDFESGAAAGGNLRPLLAPSLDVAERASFSDLTTGACARGRKGS